MDTYQQINHDWPLGKQLAFPYLFRLETPRTDGIPGTKIDNYVHGGLSKREYFAGLALSGILAGKHASVRNLHSPESLASYAVHAADELLKILETKK